MSQKQCADLIQEIQLFSMQYLVGCCVRLFETLPSHFDRGHRFAGDLLGQSWLELVPWDRFASIRFDNAPLN